MELAWKNKQHQRPFTQTNTRNLPSVCLQEIRITHAFSQQTEENSQISQRRKVKGVAKKRKEKKGPGLWSFAMSVLLVVRTSVPEFFLGECKWPILSQNVRLIECAGGVILKRREAIKRSRLKEAMWTRLTLVLSVRLSLFPVMVSFLYRADERLKKEECLRRTIVYRSKTLPWYVPILHTVNTGSQRGSKRSSFLSRNDPAEDTDPPRVVSWVLLQKSWVPGSRESSPGGERWKKSKLNKEERGGRECSEIRKASLFWEVGELRLKGIPLFCSFRGTQYEEPSPPTPKAGRGNALGY